MVESYVKHLNSVIVTTINEDYNRKDPVSLTESSSTNILFNVLRAYFQNGDNWLKFKEISSSDTSQSEKNKFEIQEEFVSRAFWFSVMRYIPKQLQDNGCENVSDSISVNGIAICDPNLPIKWITISEASRFIHKLNINSGDNGYKYRLPTPQEIETLKTRIRR